MLQKLPTSLKVVLFSFFLTSSYAADISFSGQTEVCPGQDYTYTASASNIFGPRNGAFEWTFWRNNQVIGSFGAPIVDCPAQPGTSTSTITFNWGTVLGPVKIRIRFKGVNDPLCHFNSPDVKWVDVNVRVLSPGPISGLVFCSPNETRTLSVPGILPFNSAQSCYFHHKYDWIVPNGWSVIPTGGQPFTAIAGGIRTFATSVLVTAPSTPLAPRYDGNYNVIVRTEPAWPYPTESTGKIWVGSPYDFLVSGPNLVTAGSYNNYSAVPWNGQPSFLNQGVNANGFTWSVPWTPTNAGWDCGGCVGQTAGVTAGNLSTIVRAHVQNVCGTTIRNYEVFVQQENCPPGGCEEPFFVYPNPSSDELTVSTNSTDADSNSEITLRDSNGTVVYSSRIKNQEQIKIPVKGFRNGIYYLSVTTNGTTKHRQIIINH